MEEEKKTLTVGDWEISYLQGKLMKSKEFERFAHNLHETALPEMLYGDSYLKIRHLKKDFKIEFNTPGGCRLLLRKT